MEFAVAVGLDLAVTLHGIQAARQAIEFIGLDAKRLGDRRRVLQAACSTEYAENFLAAGNGIRVLAQMILLLMLLIVY